MQEKFIEQQLSLTDQHWQIILYVAFALNNGITIQIKLQISVKTS